MKKCTKCGEVKALTSFTRDAQKVGGLRPSCRACRAPAADPVKVREMHRRASRQHKLRGYGLTEEGYADLFDAQAGRCAICQTKSGASLAVDHCHATGRIRGLLCSRCNQGLGYFLDRSDLLHAAAAYLTGSPVGSHHLGETPK